jgi:hypothetical protein
MDTVVQKQRHKNAKNKKEWGTKTGYMQERAWISTYQIGIEKQMGSKRNRKGKDRTHVKTSGKDRDTTQNPNGENKKTQQEKKKRSTNPVARENRQAKPIQAAAASDNCGAVTAEEAEPAC